MEETEEKTVVVEPTTAVEGEVTVAAAPVTCPVCQAQNPVAETWCIECGFRLDAEPGEPVEAPEDGIGVRLVSEPDGREYFLQEGDNIVGRAAGADVLLDFPSVSRRHALLSVHDGAVILEDLGSTNGTRVNNQAASPGQRMPLPAEAKLRFGDIALSLVGAAAAEAPAEEQTAEEIISQPEGPALITEDGTRYPLPPGVTSVGRRGENDLALADPYISGRHAQIIIEAGTISVEDVGSTNGTFVNGERLSSGEPRELTPGDTITFGRLTLKLDITTPLEGAADEEPENELATADEEPLEEEDLPPD
jgi:pSer/pThr/pTyr-binding forkhead associated (FHA) protein